MIETIAGRIIDFNRELHFSGELPYGFRVLNPFTENPETIQVMEKFYRKYYDDSHKRKFIIGINPGRHGAGVTGIPFTDTKRLESECGIDMKSAHTHEVSSIFIYDMIAAYGGPEKFYSRFYINSPFPLAIIHDTGKGKWVNANYYDDKKLFASVKSFMVKSLQKHIDIGLETSEVFVLGKKNADFINELNRENHFFDHLTVLEHPRFIQQYRSKDKQVYIDKYLSAFGI